MERSVGSGGVLKKKSSSGCLIIKKKGEFGSGSNSGGGYGGFSGGSKGKRANLAANVSGSSDENESLEFMRRRVSDKRLHVESSEYRRSNAGVEIGGERKRSRLDLFEFDEYDEFDGKKMRSGYMDGDFRMAGHRGGGGSSGRNLGVDKRKQVSGFDGSSGGRDKGADNGGSRRKGYDLEDDESHIPISLLKMKYQDKSNQAIRLQGKNGVLKVMVNKKKNIELPSQNKSQNPRVEERRGSGSERVSMKDSSDRVPVYRELKPPETTGLNVNRSKIVEKDKKEVKSEKTKPTSSKAHKPRDLEIKGTDVATKSAPEGVQASSSKKIMEREAEVELSPPPEISTPAKQKGVKECKPKPGGSTEKQMLREKIREMLIGAGWTIDYRPRRNRDYLDAVYISTNGTAYWSIIKAYEAFKRQSAEDSGKSKLDVSSSSPASLPDSLIHKLTRRTKKKIEEETKRKRKEAFLAKSAKKSDVRESSESSDSDQNQMRQDHKSLTGDLHEGGGESEDDLANHQPKRKVRKVKGEKISLASDSTMLQSRTTKIIGRCTLLVRGSDKGKEMEPDGYVPYTGKRTLLGWLIDSGTAQLSEKLQYMNRKRTRVMLEGWITREGIHCGCCSKILTVSKFELHAGSKLRQPFQNIFLESGASLLQCQIDAWNKQDEPMRKDFHSVDVDGDDPDDDTCGICGDGGDLICCDSCPSTFHQTCIGIRILPSGDWHCQNCICKFCGVPGNASDENDSSVKQLSKCGICESKYHISCSEEVSALPKTSNGTSFCGLRCQELYDHLQKILGVRHELEAGFSWSFIQRTDVSDASHRLYYQKVECNSKLAVASSVMDECFMPIFDRRSGINMIHNVVYNCGSNFNRLDYRGFYTAILERGDEIIAAACIRIHGTRLAEMPFIGTREIYRRQGMCRRLLCAIEAELCSLKIEHLVIPAIPEHMKTWTGVFGFHEIKYDLKYEIKAMNMLVFPGTDMLQKPLVKPETSDVVGIKVSESSKDQLHLPRKSDIDSSTVHNGHFSSDSGGCHDTKNNDESDALVSRSATPALPSDDNTADAKTNHESDALVSRSAIPACTLDDNKPDTRTNHVSDEPVSSFVIPVLPSDDNKGNTKTNDEADSPVPSSGIPALHPGDNKADSKTNCESDVPLSGSVVPVFHSEDIKADTKTGDESDARVCSSEISACPSGVNKVDSMTRDESNAPASAIPALLSADSKAETKTGDESDSPVSSNAIPAFPSDDIIQDNASNAICESDICLASKQTIVVNSEFEKPTGSLKDNKKSVEVVIPCEVECPLKSCCMSSGETRHASEAIQNQKLSALGNTEIATDQANADSAVKVSEGATSKLIVDKSSFKSSPGFLSEVSTHGTTDEVNLENDASSVQVVSTAASVQVVSTAASVQLKPELCQATLAVRESEFHLLVEPSLDSDKEICNATASCIELNVEVSSMQLSSDSSPTISANDVQILGENEKTASMSTLSDGECIMTGGARIEDVKDAPVISGFVQESANAADIEKPGNVKDESVISVFVQESAADSEKLDNIKDKLEFSGHVQESANAADTKKSENVKDGFQISQCVQEFANPADSERAESVNDEPVVSGIVQDSTNPAESEKLDNVKDEFEGSGSANSADTEQADSAKDELVISGFVQEAAVPADCEKLDNKKDEFEVSGSVPESANSADPEQGDSVKDEFVISGFVQEVPPDSEKLDNAKEEFEVSGSVPESANSADPEQADSVKDELLISGFVQEAVVPADSEMADGEVKLPSAFDGKLVSLNHSEEAFAQSEATKEEPQGSI